MLYLFYFYDEGKEQRTTQTKTKNNNNKKRRICHNFPSLLMKSFKEAQSRSCIPNSLNGIYLMRKLA